MEPEEPGLNDTYPGFAMPDEAGLPTDFGGSHGGLPADDYGGFGNADFESNAANSKGFEAGGDNSWWGDKQDDDSFSNVPTAAPPTARGGGLNNSQGFGATMGGSTDQDWFKPQSNWPKGAGKPEHQAQWESNTMDHLNHAKMLIQKASAHHSDNDRRPLTSRKGNQKSGTVYSMIKKKMSITNDLIRALEDRHESIEDTIRQVGECLFQLQRAHRSKWSVLNVCERRLELRDTRPLQELVRDHAQEGLEHERQTLIESRQELADQIVCSKETLLSLDRLKTEVVGDLSSKRQGIRLDRSCLNPTAKGPSTQERVVLPALGEVSNYSTVPASPKDSERGSGQVQEESKQVDTKSLIHKAVRMEEDAMKLCNESDAVMLQTKRECQRAGNQAQTALGRRHDETNELKRKLEAQMREIDEAVAQTEMSFGRTKKKLENQEVPLKALDKQFSASARVPKSSTGDTVQDAVQDEMEAHLEALKKNIKVLTQKMQNTRELLEHLKQSRQQLTEDYRCKLLALKIEDACLKVTARKAMELDRMDPRGGRCKVASARGAPKKEGVYSLVAGMPMDGMSEQVNLGASF